MQKVKKIPQRQCVGCRTKRDKRDLLRIVKTPEGGDRAGCHRQKVRTGRVRLS